MERVDTVFKALGDPARMRVIEFLARPEAECCSPEDRVCACDVEDMLGLSQPAVSHHLKILVQAGLVEAEKSGRWVYYRLNRLRFETLGTYLATFAGRHVEPAAKPQLAADQRVPADA
jgi:ArsR family transcriptional regulator